jgi:transcriptional regulator with XRE-family HTH domain
MTLAKRVRDFRYAKGWGPDELASRAEISRTALYQIESGKTELPRAGTLRRIAKALDVSIDVLLGHTETGSFHMPTFAQGATGVDASAADRAMSEERARGAYGPSYEAGAGGFEAPQPLGYWPMPPRERDLTRKLHELLASPLGEGVARIVEESHRLLPSRHAKQLG